MLKIDGKPPSVSRRWLVHGPHASLSSFYYYISLKFPTPKSFYCFPETSTCIFQSCSFELQYLGFTYQPLLLVSYSDFLVPRQAPEEAEPVQQRSSVVNRDLVSQIRSNSGH